MFRGLLIGAVLGAASAAPADLDINNPESIKSMASTIAFETMKYYSGNITNTPEVYWWQAGACWGAMLDYSHYTGDSSYDDVITQALQSQVLAPDFNLMNPRYFGSEGNDDQAFWAFTILEAAERNWPQPDDSLPPWITVAENIWNTMISRWDETTCGGGLHWQIFDGNPNGIDYKNAVSNGGLFQVSARLARATNDDKYFQWAEKIWDWSENVGFIDKDFNVFDGASSKADCKDTNPLTFSYSQGIYMYGAAVLFDYKNGDQKWGDRADGLLQASRSYFTPFDNATDIMYEHACELVDTCNTDMKSFKGYLSRFMAATAQLMPSTRDDVQELLRASAIAAGKACSGGDSGTSCGQKWYVGGYDGNTGLGQQMTALETVQALLAFDAPRPLKFGEIKHLKDKEPIVIPPPSTTETTAPPEPTTPMEPMEPIEPIEPIEPSETTDTADTTITLASPPSTVTVVKDVDTAPTESASDTQGPESVAHVTGVSYTRILMSLLTSVMIFSV
ncbi:mannan endo-1,6-alpha-mannosidase DCW1-like protein [Xylaria bambusicola]|uniref:mannan endo-1,6-alpha-mannosidase DCW1-like protein n=1 Tax=Xylaria bambusicola TaxID=326684 RepID=UPI002008E719|nr:mannan endo-1,6-alpha-mannosidase DCW1-like protein [Xylaria bambusicola]KAI0516720.1 mannan endo-1,6-alpha-mannosidase DCW1-like protein [Xylaria bambusicola]